MTAHPLPALVTKEYRTLTRIAGPLVFVERLEGAAYGEIVEITGPDGEDTIAIRTCAYFSISFDHRVVDGADADRFMAVLKKTLENVTG